MDAKKTIAVVLFICICITIGWLGRGYYDDRATDSNDASVTIQQAQRDNQSTRADLGDAAAQIDDAQATLVSGQADIAAAAGRVDELQSQADADAAVLDECQSFVDVGRIQLKEAKRIFEDVDNSNQLDD